MTTQTYNETRSGMVSERQRNAEDEKRKLDHQATENALRFGRMLGGILDQIGAPQLNSSRQER